MGGTERDLARAQALLSAAFSSPGRGAKLRRMSVRVRKQGPVTTRHPQPPVRGKTRGIRETARSPEDAFRAFEAEGTREPRGDLGRRRHLLARGTILKAFAAGKYDTCHRRRWAMGPVADCAGQTGACAAILEATPSTGASRCELWCDMRVVSRRTRRSGCLQAWGVPLIDGRHRPVPRPLIRALAGAPTDSPRPVRWRRSPARSTVQNPCNWLRWS